MSSAVFTAPRRLMRRPGRCLQSLAMVAMVALLPMVLWAQSYSPADLDAAFGKDTLVIRASKFACHRFDIWVAIERSQQTRGLMFVRNLPEHTGMLFVYDEPGRRSMWMKNTYVPLDIVFVRADGAVSSIVENAEPLSLRSLSSIEPVTYVLELGGGVSATLGITSGDRIFWSGLDDP